MANQVPPPQVMVCERCEQVYQPGVRRDEEGLCGDCAEELRDENEYEEERYERRKQ